MIVYSKTGVKSKQVAARIYIRENSIVLRLFLNKIDKHREFIENSIDFIKAPFVGYYGNCHHCHNDKGGTCRFRKTYTIDDICIEKCNGVTYEFPYPDLEKLPAYMDLLNEFYPKRKSKSIH